MFRNSDSKSVRSRGTRKTSVDSLPKGTTGDLKNMFNLLNFKFFYFSVSSFFPVLLFAFSSSKLTLVS